MKAGWRIVCGLLLLASIATTGESVQVVKLVDYTGAVTYELKTTAELRILQKEIREEAPLAQKALDATKKAWRADPEHGRAPFPGSAIVARQALAMGAPITDSQRADAKLAEYQDKAFTKTLKAGQPSAPKAAARAQVEQDVQTQFASQLQRIKQGGPPAEASAPARSRPVGSASTDRMRDRVDTSKGRLYVNKCDDQAALDADLLANNGLRTFDGNKLSSAAQTGEGVFDLQKLIPGAGPKASFTLTYEGAVNGPDELRGATWSSSPDNQTWAVVSINEFGKPVIIEGRYLKLQMRWIGATDAGYGYLTRVEVRVNAAP